MPKQWARYLTPTPVLRQLGLVCLGAGQQRTDTPLAERTLDCYAAVLITEGSGWFRSGSSSAGRQIDAPTLFWLFPGVPHAYAPGPHSWLELWTLFEGPAVAAYETLGYLHRADPVRLLHDPAPTKRAFERLLQHCADEQPTSEVDAAHTVRQVILSAHSPNRSDVDEDAAVLLAIREGALTPCPVREHARRLGLSLSSLRRVVRRSAGCTPQEYILRARLNRAKVLLAQSDLRIDRVAKEIGYDDPAYFSRIFSERVGTSPRTFRGQQNPQARQTYPRADR